MSCVYFFLKNAPPGALSLAIEVRALRCMALPPRAQSGTRVHVRHCSNTWSCVFFFHRGPSVYTLMAGYKAGIVPVSTPRRTCHCHSLQTTSLRVSPLPWPVGNGRLGRSCVPVGNHIILLQYKKIILPSYYNVTLNSPMPIVSPEQNVERRCG